MVPHSRLARLQQAIVGVLLVAALAWLVAWWGRNPWLAIGGAVALALPHVPVLALEFLVLVAVRRGDPAPAASPAELLAAWCMESVQDVRVFGWRQPFRWRRFPDRLTGEPGRIGIVFVHGFVCNRGFWAPWLQRAQADGHAFIAVNLEPVYGAIDDYFDTIDTAVRRLAESTGRPPALLCHSMGGLAARAWLRRRADRSAVTHVITIGTPHQGTALARWSRAPNGRQMRVQGAWLRELAAAEAAAAGLYTCWWSNCDNIVMPPSTATLPGADNRLVPGLAHVDLAFHPAVVDDTLALLKGL